MIEVRNLTKVFKEKSKVKCVALNNISFTLPDRGMIFITGKSGSGKSTLLNLMAGFDEATSGEILVDGNNIASLNHHQLNKYHGTYLGFVFQDYHLIEELNVYQNIALSLDFARNKDNGIIKETLKLVDLEGYEKRHPSELSGGQCQRVAIARSIVKNPRMILGDEPTGNLDNVTTPQVLKLLKKVSKTRLVVIVSHNLSDADTYADRIIELSDGVIVKDVVRSSDYENTFKIDDGTVYLPHHDNLTKENMIEIMESKDKITNIIQRNDGFEKTVEKNEKQRKIEFEGRNISNRNILKLFTLFFKRRPLNKLFTILMATIIISTFYVLQSFSNFNENQAVANAIISQNEKALIVHNSEDNYYTGVKFNIIPDEDINEFSSKYNGMVYKLYNSSLPIKSTTVLGEGIPYIGTYIKNFYVTESYGTLVCDVEFLSKLFGKINVIAGDIHTPDYGIIITDYIADSLMYYWPGWYSSYDDIIGEFTYGGITRCYISAIISTNYKEKYKPIIDIYKELHEVGVEYPLEDKLENCSIYPDFLEDVTKYIGLNYSVNPNYFEASSLWEGIDTYYLGKAYYGYNGETRYSSEFFKMIKGSPKQLNLDDDSLIMGYSTYNKIFKTNYTSKNYKAFTPHEITITKNIGNSSDREIYHKTFMIKSLCDDEGIYLSDNNYIDMLKIDNVVYRLYFSDTSQTEKLMGAVNKMGYTLYNNDSHGIYYVNRSIEVFGSLVITLQYIMLGVCFIYLISFSSKNVRRSYYEIGVIKTLGGRNRDISRIFMFETIVVGIVIALTSIGGIKVATSISNYVLIESFKAMFPVEFYKLDIVSIYPNLITLDLIIVVFIIFVSSLIPTLTLRKFKYIDILKAKE